MERRAASDSGLPFHCMKTVSEWPEASPFCKPAAWKKAQGPTGAPEEVLVVTDAAPLQQVCTL